MSEKYRKEVSKLTDMLRDKQRGAEAGDILRSLIDKIVLTPNAERDALVVDLYGDLAGIINLALSADKEGSKSRINAACCPATVEALNHFRMSELSAVAAGGGGFQPIDSSARIVGSPSSGRFAS